MVDASLENSSQVYAVRAHATDATVFLTGHEIFTYLKRLVTKESPLHAFDLESVKGEPAAPPPAKEKKQDAKIEGAVQIAIGVKKEADFATWYTNVSLLSFLLNRRRLTSSCIGSHEGRDDRLLQCQRMLHP